MGSRLSLPHFMKLLSVLEIENAMSKPYLLIMDMKLSEMDLM